eukprot:445624_1
MSKDQTATSTSESEDTMDCTDDNANSQTEDDTPTTKEQLKEKARKDIRMLHHQLFEGCGRMRCDNPHCASNPDVTPLSSVEVFKSVCMSLRQSRSSFDLCDLVSPLRVLEFERLFEIARAAPAEQPGRFRDIVKMVGAGFSDPDVLDISFAKAEDGKVLLPTAEESNLNLDAVDRVYSLINGAEPAINALGHSLEQISATLEFDAPHHTHHTLLRKYLVLLLNPAFLDPTFLRPLKNVCKAVIALPESSQKILTTWVSKFPEERLESIQTMLHQYITIRWMDCHSIDDVSPAVKVMNIVYEANGRSNLLPFDSFYNDAINEEFPLKTDFRNFLKSKTDLHIFSFCRYPFLLDPAIKARVLQVDAMFQMGQEYHQASIRSVFTSESPYFHLIVRRDNLVHDALVQLHRHTLRDNDGDDASDRFSSLKKPLRVKFHGEEGVDEGGVQKEFFQLIIRQLYQAEYGMFLHDDVTRLFWFNKDAFENSSEFELIGIILGLAVYNGVILDVHFPNVVYQKLVGKTKFTLDDLASFKPELTRGLRQLLDFAGDVRETFMRSFSFEYQRFGETRVVELKPGGKDIELTNKNRKEYVDLYVQHELVDSIQRQYDAFYQGFHSVCGGEIFAWFRWEELELLVCGSEELDFDALEESARYEDGFVASDQTIRDLWEVVHSLDDEQKKRFLSFCTGSDRVPIRGLGDLRLTISKSGDDSVRLPTAHTCFNHLLLPDYKSKTILLERLTLAIENAEGFGLL